jgi:hypothetical protein
VLLEPAAAKSALLWIRPNRLFVLPLTLAWA